MRRLNWAVLSKVFPCLTGVSIFLCCHMFCYACMFDLVVLDFFICNGLVCIFVFFCVSLDHFDFASMDYLTTLVLLGSVFFSTKPRDWLGRTSPK